MIKLSGPLLAKYDPTSKVASDLNSVVAALAKKDSSLWGPNTEAPTRLNWIDLPSSSMDLLPQLEELSQWATSSGLDHFVLCGMGGSSLAPEVIAKTYGKRLTILDSTDPSQILDAVPSTLSNVLVMVGSKSGSTVETASQRAFFEAKFIAAGLKPTDHMVIVTDPNSPLDLESRKNNFRVINADPNVGGRYSALSAFGLTPTALMGVDPDLLLTDAARTLAEIKSENSAAVQVASLIIEQTSQFVAFFDSDSKLPGLADWIEQLIAESTGKSETGRLPIVLESSNSQISGPGFKIGFGQNPTDLIVDGSLGSQFIFWEFVTALLGRALMVDPFDQPNVTEAKDRTNQLLAQWGNSSIPIEEPNFQDLDLQIFSDAPGSDFAEILQSFLSANFSYISVMAYLNRNSEFAISQIREQLARKSQKAVTFGWGPRFLHSTGQFHKGGQQNGAFIQITADCENDVEIPGKDLTFHKLIMAQALGDGQALASRKYPLIRIHLKNRKAGIEKIIETISKL